MQNLNNNLSNYKQSIIIAYHKNKELLYYVLKLLLQTVPNNVEIIVIAIKMKLTFNIHLNK